jgi:hypothetical protein
VFRCRKGDAGDLAATIGGALANPAALARIGEAGRQRVLERWTWQRCAELTVEQYREVLSETPVELEVRERPSVNVVQEESWVELRLRYLVHPKKSQSVRNQLYERILERCNDAPDRVAFPVSRNR